MTLAEMLRAFVRPLYETQRPAHPVWGNSLQPPSPPPKTQVFGAISTINWDAPREEVVEQTREVVKKAWK